MPADPKRGLSIVALAGDYDRVHYALVIASGAAAMGTPVALFFTMGAVRALLPDGGWRSLRSGDSGITPEARDAALRGKGVVGLEELLESCTALGVAFTVCESGLRAEGIAADALRSDIPIAIAGVVGMMADAGDDGRLLVV